MEKKLKFESGDSVDIYKLKSEDKILIEVDDFMSEVAYLELTHSELIQFIEKLKKVAKTLSKD